MARAQTSGVTPMMVVERKLDEMPDFTITLPMQAPYMAFAWNYVAKTSRILKGSICKRRKCGKRCHRYMLLWQFEWPWNT
ncbi:hypothetical protein TcWFU_002322 [Taenia crassiceps]|uniref:Uncharacterized protein n=1 Tax=Taenia crassiceps TaxID=6207 RepID=A0ABR4QK48_9CEST